MFDVLTTNSDIYCMKIIADKNIPFVKEAFCSVGEITTVDTEDISCESVRFADVLIVRSETKVNRSLLDGTNVKFVGTVTIGTDHIDLEYLRSKGIAFASAPGSNANSVKEYIIAALLHLSFVKEFSLMGKTLGVVGVGNIGSKVVKVAESLGMTVLQNDPPRARSEHNPVFIPLDELMPADIITIHVPLTYSGEDATYHLFDEKQIAKMKRGAVLINTSRGAVVETFALKRALDEKHLSVAILDVWENEPAIDIDLLSKVFLGTAHIAGYSIDGKINAVRMVYEAVCKYFGILPDFNLDVKLFKPDSNDLKLPSAITKTEEALNFLVKHCYDITFDDEQLRKILSLNKSDRAKYFRQLRKEYRTRYEFPNFTVHLMRNQSHLKNILIALGFKCEIYNS